MVQAAEGVQAAVGPVAEGAGQSTERGPAGLAWMPHIAANLQEHLADGLPKISMDASCTTSRRNGIATLRSGVMCLVTTAITAGLLIPLLVDVDISQDPKASDGTIVVRSLCGSESDAPFLNSTGWEESLGETGDHRVLFSPTFAAHVSLAIPDLMYFDGEGWRFHWPDLPQLLSFGLLNLPVLKQPIHITDYGGCDGVDSAQVVNRFGAVARKALKAAKRRALANVPSKGLPLQRTHGGILLRSDTNAMMDPETGVFGTTFSHSKVWVWLQIIGIILLGVLSINVVAVGARMLYEDWLEGVKEWVLQYDYLWQLRDLFETDVVKSVAPDQLPVSDAIEKPAIEKRSGVFTSYLQACTPFFILDHIIGNVWKNSEKVHFALVSAALQGACLGLAPLLPCVAAFFCKEVKGVVEVFVICHYVVVVAFAPMYYFSVLFWKRKPLLLLLLVSLSVCSFASVVYLVAVVIFFAQMMMADPQHVIGVMLTLGSLIFYPIIVLARLRQIRLYYKAIKEKDGAKRGELCKEWNKLKLSTRWIWIAVVTSMIELFLIVILLLFAKALYGGGTDDLDKLIPSVITPVIAVAKGAKQVQGKQMAVDEESSQAAGTAFKEIDKLA